MSAMKRDVYIGTRVDEEFEKTVKARAKDKDMDVSKYIRSLIKKDLRIAGIISARSEKTSVMA